MPSWLIKAAVQGALSRLPQPQRYNRLFQRYVTRSLTLGEDYFLQKWRQAERHIGNFAAQRGGVPERSIEIGTGWFPIVPIGMRLHGVEQVYTVDMQRLLDRDRVVDVLKMYQHCLRAGTLDIPDVSGALERLSSWLASPAITGVDLLAAAGVHSLVADARRLPLADHSVDFVSSNNTFEHIPPDVILPIFREFARVCRDRGLMSHHVDLADHYANFDPTISVYNFLRFDERRWRFFNNTLQYQNRLRVTDLRALLEQSGWRLLREENKRMPAEQLRQLTLAPEFRRYSEEDLLVYDTWLTAELAG